MKFNNIFKLVFSIFICHVAGFVGSIFTVSAIPTWYAALQKPAFAPPNWIFAPVWLTLYTLMGIALYLVLNKKLSDKKVKLGISIFTIQLVLNAIWSILFFGLQNPLAAFAEIMVLWVAIVLTIWQFWKINKKASYLLAPYIIWVTIAAILNYSIWILNV